LTLTRTAGAEPPLTTTWPTPDNCDSFGCTIVAAASCNYTAGSRTSSSIDTIVVHTAQGSYSGTYNWFQNCSASASAHYVLRSSDGEITQMVGEEDTAWHAGDSATNARSVSIELEGYIEDPDRWFTDAMYTSLAALIVDVANRQGVALSRASIIGHNQVPGCAYTGGGGRSWRAHRHPLSSATRSHSSRKRSPSSSHRHSSSFVTPPPTACPACPLGPGGTPNTAPACGAWRAVLGTPVRRYDSSSVGSSSSCHVDTLVTAFSSSSASSMRT